MAARFTICWCRLC